MTRILALSGSLRSASSNTALLRAVAMLAPVGAEISLEDSLGLLPHFNPDLEGAEPTSVLAFRARLRAADGVLISSPEYAHGVPGVLKNALDWVVGSGEFSAKPVALFNASPRATIAQASLAEIIRTMDAQLVEAAGVSLLLLGKKLSAEEIAQTPELAKILTVALDAFLAAIDAVEDR